MKETNATRIRLTAEEQETSATRVRLATEMKKSVAALDRTRKGIETAITLAAALRDKYQFAEARRALDQAGALIPLDAPAELAEQQESVRRATDDLRFVEDLDSARFLGEKNGGPTQIAKRYREVFMGHGFKPVVESAKNGADWVARSPIRKHLVAALDHWAVQEPDVETRDWLLAVTRRADPGGWSDRFRDPAVWASPSALERLTREVDLDSAHPHLVVLLFQKQQVVSGATAETESLLAAAAVRYRDNFWVQFEAGLYFTHKAPRPATALGYLQVAVSLRPHNRSALTLLAHTHAANDDQRAALACYREAVRLEPNDPYAHSDLASALSVSGDLNGAVASYIESIKHNPKHALTHFNLGTIYLRQQKWSEAIASARAAIEANPKLASAHALLGDALEATGDTAGARAALTKAVQLDQRYAGRLADLQPVPVAPAPREVKP